MEICFITSFKTAYQRNRNSRTKTKNLRCFPDCTQGSGHEQYGFCGRKIIARLPALALDASLLFAAARFVLEDCNEMATRPPSEADFRTSRTPTKSWIKVNIISGADGSMALEINPELLGWHYDWKSSKKTRKLQHCLQIYVYTFATVLGERQLKLLKTAKSPCFSLYSGNQTKEQVGKSKRKREPVSVKTEPDHPSNVIYQFPRSTGKNAI